MAITYVDTSFYWTASDGWQPHLLGTLPGNTSSSNVFCCSDDGTKAVCICVSSHDNVQSSVEYCVITNGVITSTLVPLTILGVAIIPPRGCSSDASVIWGGSFTPVGYWTESGAVGHAFATAPNAVSTSIVPYSTFGAMSSDGTVFYGEGSAIGATVWVNNVPTSFTSSDYLCFLAGDSCGGSLDGSTYVVGGISQSTDLGFIRLSDGIFHPLTLNTLDGTPVSRGITTDGSVIWATTGQNDELFYWDSLGTVDGFGNHGVIHKVATLVGDIGKQMAPDASSPPITFGPGAGFVNGDFNVYKVIGTTPSILSPLSGDTQASFFSCSGNGNIACGSSYDSGTFISTPIYWDNSLVPHALSAPAGALANSTTALLVSRDGSVIFGAAQFPVTIPDPPPPAPPPPPPVLVKLFPTDSVAGDYFLIDTDGENAQFPTTFGQFSINVWCCQAVTLRWPTDAVPGQPFGLLEMTPSSVHAEFRDADLNLLFSGTFTNPNQSTDLYNIAFAIDTEAQVVTCFGNSIEWTSTDSTFPQVGDIGNVS